MVSDDATAIAAAGLGKELIADDDVGDLSALMSAHEMSAVDALGLEASKPSTLPERGVFCTRELDMREIKVIGYDMDYTLIDYKMLLFEERVYHYSKEFLRSKGFPVSGLKFNPELVVRGIIIDRQLGNLLKVDRFGYVRRAMHGSKVLTPAEIATEYGPEPPVDLRDSRWIFLNTLFSVSEGCLYAQLVDRLDSGELLAKCQEPFDATRCSTYEQLYQAVQRALFKAHVQSKMKEEVMRDPLRFVNVDPAFTRTLLDQRAAGKKLVLITNSDFLYTSTMMHATYDPFLPDGDSWRDLFSVVVVSACKPDFFDRGSRRPVYEIATADGMLRESFEFQVGRLYAGGSARLIEKCLECSGAEVLYVGDHLFTDVNMAKRSLGWRTCMVLQELEAEMAGLREGEDVSRELTFLLKRKDQLDTYLNYVRMQLLLEPPAHEAADGAEGGSGVQGAMDPTQRQRLESAVEQLQRSVLQSEQQISALVHDEGHHVNGYWGYMSRAGFADKSHLMRQIEKYADIYTSRVSNMLPYTPFKQFLCMRQSLAHSTRSVGSLEGHWQIVESPDDCDGDGS